MIVLPSVGKSSLLTLTATGCITAGVTCSIATGLVAKPKVGKASGSLVTNLIGLFTGGAVYLESALASGAVIGLASWTPTWDTAVELSVVIALSSLGSVCGT